MEILLHTLAFVGLPVVLVIGAWGIALSVRDGFRALNMPDCDPRPHMLGFGHRGH